ncbi:MAG: hypothetical protein QUV05_01325 [Phycisphaerae bacterium]|nr:hypothetical protein [Phycisphaerae bacterium]
MSNRMTRGVSNRIPATILFLTASIAAADDQPATTPPSMTARPSEEGVTLEWVGANAGKPFFTSRDIVRFDWDRQVFELTRERAMDLMSLPPRLRRDFTVRDREGEIYRGCFMSLGSSFSYDGPTISSDFFEVEGIRPPLYHIAGGYPGEHGPAGKRRFDARLKKGLESAGVLRTINKDEKLEPIETVFCGWHGEALGCRAAITLFPETVRVGHDIRLVLRFAQNTSSTRPPGERERRARQDPKKDRVVFWPEPDQVEARVTLKSDESKARRTRAVQVSMEKLAEDLSSAFRVWPWSESGRSVDDLFKPGPAELTLSILATRKTDKGIEQVGVWDIPPRQVKILPSSK